VQCFDTFRGFFYINFTLRQWTGMVERSHIIVFSRRLGAGTRQRGQLPPPTCWRRPCRPGKVVAKRQITVQILTLMAHVCMTRLILTFTMEQLICRHQSVDIAENCGCIIIMWPLPLCPTYVDRVKRFRLTLRFFDNVSTASWCTFSIPTSNFFDDASEFSVCSYYAVFNFFFSFL